MPIPSVRETLGTVGYQPPTRELSFSKGFTGDHESQGAWWTSGLFGLLASKLATGEQQEEWFIQRNAIDYEYNQLQGRYNYYQQIADSRGGLTDAEHADASETLARMEAIKSELAFVHNNLDGNLDAAMDEEGNSFNDRWGVDSDDEDGLMELLSVFVDNPSYAGGVITGELVKDSPFFGIAKLLGMTSKTLKISDIVNKVNTRLGKIQGKATRGLARIGTGVGAGTVAGAGYEALYSTLEQGTPKSEDIWMGAKFGAAFGILGGAGLLYSGSQLSKIEVAVAESIAATGKGGKGLKKAASKETKNAVQNIRKAAENDDSERVTQQAQATSILNDVEHDIKSIPGESGDRVALITTSDMDGRIKTIVNEKAMEFEHKQLLKELDEAEAAGLSWRGISDLTARQSTNLRNFHAYRMMRIAQDKARETISSSNIVKTLNPQEIEQQAFQLALDELNRADANFRGPTPMKEIEAATQLTPEQVEAAKIKQQRKEVEGEAEELIPPPPGLIGKALEEHPKKALAAGAGIGYALTDTDDEKLFGVVLGVGAALLGPKAYKALTSNSLKASVMKIKVSLARDIGSFSRNSKIFEFQMQEALKEVADVFNTPAKGMKLIDAIEDPTIKLNARELEVKNRIVALLDIIGEQAVDIGILRPKGSVTGIKFGALDNDTTGAFLNNYFPHIFDKNLTEKDIQELVDIYLKESKNIKERTLKQTNAWIRKHTKKKIIVDPVKALQLYTQSMTRTIYGRNLIKSLFDLSLNPTGVRHLPALMSREAFHDLRKTDAKDGGLSPQEALHYEEFDHPTLKGYVAHSDIKPMIDDQFALLRRGGAGEVMEGILKLNNGLKRLFVFGSLFHAQALVMSAAYSLGRAGLTGKPLGGRVTVRDKDGTIMKDANGDTIYRQADFSDLKLGSAEFNEIVEEAIRNGGLEVINVKKADLVNAGFEDFEELAAKAGFIGKGMSKVFEKTDWLTWEYFHDRFKVATYIQKRQKTLDDWKKQGIDINDKDIQIQASQLAGRFANDAYGSLDWNDFGHRLYTYASNNPDSLRGKTADKLAGLLPINKRRWLNLGLFAPDWTISNIRIVANTFTSGYSYSKGFIKAFHKGDTAAWKSKEGRMLASSFKMYAAYTGRASLITSGMWWAMSEANNAMFSNPEPTMDGLMDFWFGEKSHKMNLGNGESMVISKQIAEPIHWLQHPQHTLMNKASIMPKTLMEGMFNKQWFSMKKGFPMGPSIVDPDGTSHTSKWLFGKMVPIVTKPMFDTSLSWSEKLERTFGGFFGFPQYGKESKGKYDY